uniref:BPTI/Kunitz inhibitor domain-containing protein n=1 Tax=Globodera pallida TaxID=36090 RepID=A0A183CA46_GLOPA
MPAAQCPCRWTRCIKTEAFKASRCCKEGYEYKCSTELIQELRAKEVRIAKRNFTCFRGPDDYKGWMGFVYNCCETDMPLKKKKPDEPISSLPWPPAGDNAGCLLRVGGGQR